MTSGRNSSAVMGQPAQSPHLILGGMPVTDHCFNTIPSLPLDVIMTSLMTSKVSGGNCTPTHTGSSKKMYTGTPSWVHTHAPLYTHRGMRTHGHAHTHGPTHMGTTTHVSLHAPKGQIIRVHTQRCVYMFPKESVCRHMHSHSIRPMCMHRYSNANAYTWVLLHAYICIDICTVLYTNDNT